MTTYRETKKYTKRELQESVQRAKERMDQAPEYSQERSAAESEMASWQRKLTKIEDAEAERERMNAITSPDELAAMIPR